MWSILNQGRGGVNDYIKRFERLTIDGEIEEMDNHKDGRFIVGLNRD